MIGLDKVEIGFYLIDEEGFYLTDDAVNADCLCLNAEKY